MSSTNEHTGDRLVSKLLSEEGKNQFDAIFGKRDWRNRPIVTPTVDQSKPKAISDADLL